MRLDFLKAQQLSSLGDTWSWCCLDNAWSSSSYFCEHAASIEMELLHASIYEGMEWESSVLQEKSLFSGYRVIFLQMKPTCKFSIHYVVSFLIPRVVNLLICKVTNDSCSQMNGVGQLEQYFPLKCNEIEV